MRRHELRTFLAKLVLVCSSLAVLGQTPSLQDGPGAGTVLGSGPVSFTYNFQNSGSPGFGPYIRLILPPGVSFNGAMVFGVAASANIVGTFPVSPGNQLTDPVTGTLVTGPDGGTLVIVTYPVGSVVTGGPDLEMTINATVADTVPIGVPLPIDAIPVYRFGNTPTGVNGPIVGAVLSGTITPTLYEFFKTNDAPESERPPGPSWPYTYTLRVDVAELETIENILIRDTLPADVQYIGPPVIMGGTGCAPTLLPSTVTPGGVLEISCSSITGTSAADDLVITYQVYITDTLDETNCVTELKTNSATLDAEFPLGVPQPQLAVDSEVTAKHLAIQKGLSPGSGIPGDLVTFTLNIQVTDFGNASSVVVTDLLPDGFTFNAHQSFNYNGGPLVIVPSVVANANGTTTITYDVSAVTGTLPSGSGATLVYTANVDQDYTPAPDPILGGDSLTNTVSMAYDLVEGAAGCSDGSGATFDIVPVQLVKSIVSPQPQYVPGDVITYRLELGVPSGDTEDIVLEDFFPLPVHDVSTLNLTFGTDIRLAPSDTAGLAPSSISIIVGTNSLRLEFPPVVSMNPEIIAVDIDIVIEDDPFADGLFLTNIAQSSTENSPNSVSTQLAPVQILVRAPVLEVTKGIAASSNPLADATISPSPAILPVDGDISQSDAGDTLTYVITVQNTGGATAFDVEVTDPTIPGLTGFTLVSVTDGNGLPLATTGAVPTGLTITSGITADDMAPGGTDEARITYTAQIDTTVEPNQVLTNTASAVWRSSLTGLPFTSSSDTATATMARPTVDKTIDAIVPNAAGPGLVTSGDVVTYRLLVTMPEGITNNLTLTDALPAGFAFVSATVDATGFAGTVDTAPTITPSGVPNTGQSILIAFDSPAATTVTGDNNTSNNSFAVLLEARVLGSSPSNDGLPTVQAKNNTVTLDYTGRTGGTISDSVSTNFAEPELAITKTMSPDSGLDAGDVVTITLQLQNTGTAPAYDVVLTDTLNDAGVLFDLGSVMAGTTPANYSFNYTNPTVTYTRTSGSLAVGGMETFTFTAVVSGAANAGATYSNQAGVAGDSQSGVVTEERAISDTGSDSLTLNRPSISKTIDSIAPNGAGPGLVTSGDVVAYRLQITLPEGTTPDLTLTDALPAGFEFVSATVDTAGFAGTVDAAPTITPSGVPNTGQSILIAFDSPASTTVTPDNNTANNSFSVVLEARVLGSSPSNDGLPAVQAKNNTGTVDYTGRTGGAISDSASTNFAEPELAITKAMSPDSGLDAGDVVTITLQIQNTGTAPAYDVVVTDTLNDDGALFDLASVMAGTTPANYIFNYANPTVTFTRTSGSLAPGGMETFTFTAVVSATANTGSSYSNDAGVVGDSQLGLVVEERATMDTGSDTVTTQAVSGGKSIIATSESWTSEGATPQLAIGEIATYQLSFTIPEGVTLEDGVNAMVTDTLPSGFSYLTGSAMIRATYDTGMVGSVFGPIPTTDTAIVPGIVAQRLDFDLGNLTVSDSDAGAETLIITYQAQVLNTSDNNRTNTKTNSTALNYLNRDGMGQSVTDSLSTRIVEPRLTLVKDAAPASVTGGATVTFTVILGNTTGGFSTRAWEPVLTDTLPARYQSPSVTSAILSRGATDVSGSAGFVGNLLTANLSSLAATEQYLAPGETITVVYTAIVDPAINFEEQVTNTARVEGTSLPGTNGTGGVTMGAAGSSTGERTGTGVNNELGQNVNDLNATDSATVTANRPTVTKTGNANLQIGETTIMSVAVDIPVGTTNNFVLTDNLPTGLSYTGTPIVITLPAMNFTNSLSPSTTPGAGTDPLVFDFGTVNNSGTMPQSIQIDYEVIVQNILGNQNNTALTNTATLTYTGASMPFPADSATITVVEPNLTIGKTITAGAAGSDAGDTVSYQVTLQNTGTVATAYAVDLQDVLPAELLGALDGTGSNGIFFLNIMLTNPGNSVVLSSDGVTPLVNGDAVFSTASNLNDSLGWPAFNLPPSTTLTVNYDVVVANTAVAGQMLTNLVTATYQSSETVNAETRDSSDSTDDDDGNLDNYGETGSTTLTIDSAIAISKGLAPTEPDSNYAIGEIVTYDLRVDVIEGVKGNVVVTDVLPAGLLFQAPVSIVATPNISYSGAGTAVEAPSGTLTIDMGSITNLADGDTTNDFFIIRVQALVQDVPGNINTTMLTNTVSLTSDVGPAGPDTQVIQVVEPILSITKVPDDAFPSLGDVVTFTVTVRHTMASLSDAFEVVLTDAIPAGLTYVPGSTTGMATVDETTPNQPIFDLGAITLADVQKSFSFDVVVDLSATVGQPITNTIDAVFSSLPGVDPNERDYAEQGSGDVTPSTPAFIEADKTVAISMDAGNVGIADPGDELIYTVVLTNGATTASNAFFTDTLPAVTTYVPGSLTSSVGGEDDSSAPDLLVTLGTMNPMDVVTITFRVTVNAGTPAGTVISNQGVVDSDDTIPEPTDSDGTDANGDQPTDITVGGPPPAVNALYVEKVVTWINDGDTSGDITAGDTMRYTLVFHNDGDADLTNVTLTDVIPAGLTYVAASATIASMGDTISVVGADVSVNIALLGVKQSIVATFDVTIDAFAPPTMTFINQGSADSDQTNPTLTDSNGEPQDGNQPTQFTAVNGITGAPLLDLEKRWSLLIDVDGDGLVDPGDTLEYRLVLTNIGSATATNLRLSDSTPADTSAVLGSATTSLGVIVGEDPLDVNIGDLDPGELATIRFNVVVNPGTPNGTIIPNQAFASADNAPDTPSDDNGNDDDGLNPTLTPVSTDGVVGMPTGLSKTLLATSEPDSMLTSVFIGEAATYELAIALPAGTLDEVTLIDTLPMGLIYQPGTAELARVFDTGINSSENPGGINSSASGVFVPLTDGSDIVQVGDELQVFLGSIINSDNDMNAEQYVLRLTVQVENIAGNQAGTTLTNSASLSYANQLGQIQTLAPVTSDLTVLEADLQVSKTVAPLLLLPAGGTVTFTFVVTNPSAATVGDAYDVNIVDMLPAAFSGLTVNSIVPAGGVSGITDNSAGSNLDVAVDVFPPDGMLTIEVDATLPGPIAAGTTISNNVNVRWTSLPGTNGTGDATIGNPGDSDGERTGDGTGVNDLVATDTADVVIGEAALTKTILMPQTRYAIGDVLTYQVIVEIPPNAILDDSLFVDVLDEGLAYETASLQVMAPMTLSFGLSPADFTVTQDTPAAGQESLTLDWATLSNSDSVSGQIVLTYNARIENILPNQDNSILNNNATYSFTDPGGSGGTISVSEGTMLTLGEPHLAMTKGILSSVVSLDAGDTITYEVTISNDGTTTAFDVVAQDVLPTGLENITGLMVTASSGGAEVPMLTNNGSDWITSAFDLPVSGSVTLEFTATISVGVIPGQAIQNSVTASFQSQDGMDPNGRDGSTPDSDQDDDSDLNNYNDTANSPTITIADEVAIDKQFYPDPARTTYTIGETFTYRVLVSLIEGTLNDVVVTDVLPAGVAFIDAQVGLGNLGMTTQYVPPVAVAGQTLTFDLGQVVNPGNGDATDDFIAFDIDVRIENIMANQNGTILGNNASIAYTGTLGPVVRDFDADAGTPGIQPLELTIVEPDLALTKMTKSSLVAVGDEVTFTLTLSHTMASTSDAYDIRLVDTLPIGLVYVLGSGSLTPVIDGRDLIFTAPALTLLDGSLVITYRVRVESAQVGVPLMNSAVATYSSLAGDDPNERTGEDGPGGLNDYETNEANAVVSPAGPVINAPKSATLTGDVNMDGQVNPGDTLTYTIVFTNSGNAAATGVSFNDVIEPNLTLVNGSVTTTQGTIILGNGAGDSTIEISIGDVPGMGGSVTITFDAMVNDPLPMGVVTVENQGFFATGENPNVPTDDPDTPTMDDPTVTPVVSGPQLSLTKIDTVTVNPDGVVGAGDTVTYNLVLSNTGDGASGTLVFTDTPDGNTALVVGSVTTTQGTVTIGNTAGDTSVSIDIGVLAANTSVDISFEVVINDPLPKGVNQIVNQGLISEDGNPVVMSDDPDVGGPDDPTVTPLGDNPIIEATKTDALTNDLNANMQLDPGEELTYTVVITNTGQADANGVAFSDMIEPNLTLVEGSVTTTQGSVTLGNGAGDTDVAVNVGTILAGNSVTITFAVTLNNPLADGVTQVANQGIVSTNGIPDVPTDDPDLPGEDDPTITPVGSQPMLHASKSDALLVDDGDGIASAGDTLRYTVILTNTGNVDLTGVSFSDSPDVNTLLVVGSVTTSMGSVLVGNTAGDTSVAVDVGGLVVGANVTITFDVLINTPLPIGLTFLRNQGLATSDTTQPVETDDPDVPGDEDPTDTPLGNAPLLEAYKTDVLTNDADGDGIASAGDTLTYLITISNMGNGAAANVVFTDYPDANTSLVPGSVFASQGVIVNGNGGTPPVVVEMGLILGGGNVTISFDVLIDSPLPAGVTELVNQGVVTSDDTTVVLTDDPDTPDEDDPTVTPLGNDPVLSASKVDSLFIDADGSGNPSPGDTLLYQITVRNTGNGPATAVVLNDTPDTNTTLVPGSVQTSQGTIDNGQAGTPPVTVTLGTIPAGGQAQVSFQVTINSPLPTGVVDVVNQGTVSSMELPTVRTDDPSEPGDEDPNVTPVVSAPLVDAFKTDVLFDDADGDGIASGGDTLIYVVTITNSGNATALNLAFTDTPDPLTSLVPGSVQTSQGAITGGNAGSPPIVVQLGDLPVNGTATISFQVVINEPVPVGVTSLANQGTIRGDNIVDVPTDDPDTPDTDDPTVTPLGTDPLLSATKVDILVVDADMNGVPSEGDTLEYVIAISNTGNGPANNVVFSDTPDVNTTLVSGSVLTTLGTVTGGNAGTPPVTVAIGTIPANGSATVSFRVTINSPLPMGTTSVANQGVVSSDELPDVDTDDPDTTDPDDETETPLGSDPILDAYKADSLVIDLLGDGAASPGDTILYTVTITNSGNGTAIETFFEDTPDPNTTIVPGSVQTSQGQVLTGDDGNPPILVALGVIGPGDSATVTFRVTVNVPFPTTLGTVANQGVVRGTGIPDVMTDDPDTSNPDDETVTPIVQADLVVVKTAPSTPIVAGLPFDYTIDVTNLGPDDATGLVLVDTLPMNVDYISHTTSQGMCSYDPVSRVLTCELGDLAVGNSLQIVLSVFTLEEGMFTNTVTITGDQFDPDGGNNDSDAEVVGLPGIDLELGKSVDNPKPDLNQNITFTLTLTNLGPDTATGVIVRDLLPVGFTYVADTPSQGTYNSGTGLWTVGSLALNQTETLDIEVQVTGIGALQNFTEVIAADQTDIDSTPDNGPGEDDAALVDIQVNTLVDLRVTKVVEQVYVRPGDVVNYTITVENLGPDTANNVQVAEALPAGITAVNAITTQGSFDPVTRIWSVGTLLVGEGAVLELEAVIDENTYGELLNVALATSDEPDINPDDNDDTATVTSLAPVPTLGTWGLIAFLSGLALLGAWFSRKNRLQT